MTNKEKMQALVDEIAERCKTGTLELAVEGTDCRFITKDDKRCFMGQYMPLEWLKANRNFINRYTLSHALFELEKDHPEVTEKFPRTSTGINVTFMHTIQNVHDSASAATSYEDFAIRVNAGMGILCMTYHLEWGGTS